MRRVDEKGVSPVIGVILMVAITVILAAVIASFVFGMTSTAPQQKTPGIIAERTGDDEITFTLTGWGGAASIKECKLDDNDCDPADFSSIGDQVKCNGGRGSHTLVCKVDNVEQIVWKGTI